MNKVITLVTKWLHAGLMLGAAFQLSSSLIMTHPDDKGGSVGQLLMKAYQIDGLIIASIVLANLIWAMVLRGNPKNRQLSVLFSVNQWREAKVVLKNLPAALMGKAAFIEPANTLSLIVEMLGLLAMTGMAVTGAMIWFEGDGIVSHNHSHLSQRMEYLMDIHSLLSKLFWLFVAGHVSMALMHVRAGNRPFARIAPFSINDKMA